MHWCGKLHCRPTFFDVAYWPTQPSPQRSMTYDDWRSTEVSLLTADCWCVKVHGTLFLPTLATYFSLKKQASWQDGSRHSSSSVVNHTTVTDPMWQSDFDLTRQTWSLLVSRQVHVMQTCTSGPSRVFNKLIYLLTCQVIALRLWPAADHEQYCRHMSIDKNFNANCK